MRVRTWQFSNYHGRETEPGILTMDPEIEVHWFHPSNRIVVEGVFSTGDEHHQIILNHLYIDEGALKIHVKDSVIESEYQLDVGRLVPYEVDVELYDGFPETVEVTHLNRRGEEALRQTSERPDRT